MAIIAISGRKGGIGKTTIAANLAAEMVAAGRTVAVFDADPQGSLMAWAGLGDGMRQFYWWMMTPSRSVFSRSSSTD